MRAARKESLFFGSLGIAMKKMFGVPYPSPVPFLTYFKITDMTTDRFLVV
jgi:hypothetical protein